MSENRAKDADKTSHDMHEKFNVRSLKTEIRSEVGVKVNSGGWVDEGYATAHTISGGDRMELFAIRKPDHGQSRFWLQMELDDAEEYAKQILREVERARGDE